MKSFNGKVRDNGIIIFPDEIMDQIGLKEGDEVQFDVIDD